MFGTISTEMEVKAAASEAWKVYGAILLADIIREYLPQFVQKTEVLEGDGGVGTVILVTFTPGKCSNYLRIIQVICADFNEACPTFLNGLGATGFSQQKEKITVVDNEKRVKVVEVIEGGFLEQGLDLYRLRFEVIEKQKQKQGEEKNEGEEDSCITKGTVEYETKDVAAANVAVSSIQIVMAILKAVSDYLTKNNN